jgi:uncharacterized repeat protein (TIGR01451 family)
MQGKKAAFVGLGSIRAADLPSPRPALQIRRRRENLTYTIEVKNNGPITATSATVIDNLPAETIFISCSCNGDAVCGGSGNNRTVTFGSLASGESETITFVATVNC